LAYRKRFLPTVAGLILLGLAAPGRAQPITVGVPVGLAPCSFRESGSWSGWAYDFWIKASADLDIAQKIKPIPSLREGIRQLANQEIDVLATCLTVTPERTDRIDFSAPMNERGLRLLQRRKTAGPLSFLAWLARNQAFLISLSALIGLALTAATLQPILERKRWNSRQFLQHTGMVLIGTGLNLLGQKPKTVVMWTAIGLMRTIVITLFTASLTKSLINDQESTRVTLPSSNETTFATSDRIGVFDESAAISLLTATSDALGEPFGNLRRFSSEEDLVNALANREIDYGLVDEDHAKEIERKPEYRSRVTFDDGEASFKLPQSLGLSKGLPDQLRDKINRSIISERITLEVQKAIGSQQP
jgi:ABC-type amino acid transport substrate-binding protein